MSRNLFEEALSRGEASKFFKGEGLYFLRNPETGCHSANVHMGGWVANYVAGEPERMAEFCSAFSRFIVDADPADKDDFSSVLENLFSYISVSGRGLLPKSQSLNDPSSEIICSLKVFSGKAGFQEYLKNNGFEVSSYINYFESNGYKILSELFRGKGG